MEENGAMTVIAHIESQFHTKFGIPRQSGLVEELEADVVFEPQFRDLNALRGLEGFSHIWLIWDFSEVRDKGWTPTVRPPRLGGNRRLGVFATRSPFRPNPIGLSCVRLAGIDPHTERGPVLRVRGADLMDGTPIYDIKPYLPYSDCKPEAVGGLCQPTQGGVPGGRYPGAVEGSDSRRTAARTDWGAGPGPQALLSTGSGPDLHHGVWRSGGKVSGRGGYPECVPNIPEEILIKF